MLRKSACSEPKLKTLCSCRYYQIYIAGSFCTFMSMKKCQNGTIIIIPAMELWIIAAGPWISTWTEEMQRASAHMLIHSPATTKCRLLQSQVQNRHFFIGDCPQPPQLLLLPKNKLKEELLLTIKVFCPISK